MVRLCCTQRVLERFRFHVDAGTEAPSTTLLGNWYANLLNVGRARWVLCLSERTLLCVLVPARNDSFPVALPALLGETLAALDVDGTAIQREVSEMGSVIVDRTHNRRAIGSMTDFAFAAGLHLESGLTSLETTLRLADTPCKPLDYGFPAHEVSELFRVAATTSGPV